MGKKHKKHKSDICYSDDRAMEKTPLKLVLKLGSEVMYDSDYAANSPASSTHESSGHRSRKRKKKRRYDDEIYTDSVLTPEIPVVDALETNDDIVANNLPIDSPKISEITETEEDKEVQMILPTPVEPKPKPQKVILSLKVRKALNNLLEHLLKQLERKDTHDVFAWPVNDMIAPGYSLVINQSMDFSTMRNKIVTNQYFNVTDFKSDFDLMINNCCIYNNPDTVYYDIAKKVSAAGIKIMSNERLKNLKRTLNFLHDLSKQELSDIFGFSVVEEESSETTSTIVDPPNNAETVVELENVSVAHVEEEDKSLDKDHDLKAHPDAISFTDADNEDSVAIDAVEAMKTARKRLIAAFPKNRIGILRMDNEGKTTLNILNPDANEIAEREIDLGGLTGSISSGFDVMPEAKEDKRNKVTPLEYLSYGPFGSYAPTYDSRMSNLTQEESDLLLSAYGSETGLLFAKSVEDFVADSNKGLVKMVDDILDTVTYGAHSHAVQEISQKRKKVKVNKEKQKADVKIDFNELKSLQNLGIDVAFLNEVEAIQQGTKSKIKDKESKKDLDVDKSLELNSLLIKRLEKEQYNRLSAKAPNDEPNLEPPNTQEQAIADELKQTLCDLTAAVTPADVCDQSAIRKAMGISTSM